MVGFYARADSTKPIRTDLDNELAGKYSTVYIYFFNSEKKKNMYMQDGLLAMKFAPFSSTEKAPDSTNLITRSSMRC